MEYLQYFPIYYAYSKRDSVGFKPYYKWNTFNTIVEDIIETGYDSSFKPYYKWNTFNTTKWVTTSW